MARYLSPKFLMKQARVNPARYKLKLYQYEVRNRDTSDIVARGRAWNVSADNQRKTIRRRYSTEKYSARVRLVAKTDSDWAYSNPKR